MKIHIFILSVLITMISCKKKLNQEEEILELIQRAKGIHERVITLDTHCDINVANFTDTLNYKSNTATHVSLPKMKSGGLDVVWFVVYTGQDSLTTMGYENAYKYAMAKFNGIHKLVEDYAPDLIELATSSNDVKRIVKSGKKVAMIGVENGYPMGLDITNLQKFYDLGARYMSLSHNGHNQLSDSCTGEADGVWMHNGLSELGQEVIKEMNRLGIMIDISHPSKEAMKQIIALSKAPIIASHSSARALCNHARNLDDEQLQWIKENNGVIQTVALDAFLNAEKAQNRKKDEEIVHKQIMDSLSIPIIEDVALSKLTVREQDNYFEKKLLVKRLASKQMKDNDSYPPAVTVLDFVDHIDYMVEKIGISHVGISSDFDGGGGIEGWMDASETFNVTLELVRRGYSEDDIALLWSGNLLRVLDNVQAIAHAMN